MQCFDTMLVSKAFQCRCTWCDVLGQCSCELFQCCCKHFLVSETSFVSNHAATFRGHAVPCCDFSQRHAINRYAYLDPGFNDCHGQSWLPSWSCVWDQPFCFAITYRCSNCLWFELSRLSTHSTPAVATLLCSIQQGSITCFILCSYWQCRCFLLDKPKVRFRFVRGCKNGDVGSFVT